MNENGSIKEFERLVIDYQPRLAAYVRHFVRKESDVNDIVQESFIALWKRYSDRVEDYPRLIFTITRNKCLNWLRDNRLDALSLHSSQVGEELLYNLDFGVRESDTQCLFQELKGQVDSVLDSLPPRCAQVFRMSRFELKKNREIAQELGISASAVEKHIRKALKTLDKEVR